MVAVVEGASTIQLTFRRSTVTAHDAPRPEAVTKPEELRLAAPESHRPLKNLVRGKLPSILLGYVNPGGARPCAHGRAAVPHPPRTLATQRPAAASFLKEWNASCRTSTVTWWSKDALPGSSSLPAACDPRFCARRGPTALPFPPTTPQAPKNPCSPPSAVLWPNLTSRSSSVYGLVPFLCGPSTTEGQDLPGPCFGHGSRTPRSSPHQRGSQGVAHSDDLGTPVSKHLVAQ